jgi:hypothetical protein
MIGRKLSYFRILDRIRRRKDSAVRIRIRWEVDQLERSLFDTRLPVQATALLCWAPAREAGPEIAAPAPDGLQRAPSPPKGLTQECEWKRVVG